MNSSLSWTALLRQSTNFAGSDDEASATNTCHKDSDGAGYQLSYTGGDNWQHATDLSEDGYGFGGGGGGDLGS